MKKTHCTFYIARHGETVWNTERVIQGQRDSPLTERGREQAEELARTLSDVAFDAVFSSDLGRAEATAEIIARPRGMSVQTSPLLREKRFGPFEGRPVEELVRAHPDWDGASDEERHRRKMSEDMESNEEVTARIITFLCQSARRNPGKTVLAVCHGGVMRYLLIHLGVGSYAARPRIGNAGYIRLIGDGVHFEVSRLAGVIVPENEGE